MELKYRSSLKSIRLRPSSNRTFMVLKLGTRTAGTFASSVLIAPLWNWNDLFSLSFLTLKLVLIAPLWNWNPSARTFSSEENAVLIAPLWNWNRRGRRSRRWWQVRSNRTFMELKWAFICCFLRSTICSNRTFMELKFYRANWYGGGFVVLIVPLWNWNNWWICWWSMVIGF